MSVLTTNYYVLQWTFIRLRRVSPTTDIRGCNYYRTTSSSFELEQVTHWQLRLSSLATSQLEA